MICLWIGLWWLAAFCMDSALLLPAPPLVFCTFFSLLANPLTWQSIAFSLFRILGGFFLACLFAFVCALISECLPIMKDFFDVPMQIAKTLPVACFIVLLLIWQGAVGISFWISFLMALPPMYQGLMTGLSQVDLSLKEVSKVFSITVWNRLLCLYRPALRNPVLSGAKLSVSLSIKAGIAAELIGVPAHTIGEQLYFSKIYLNTDELFAWSILILLLGKWTESIVYALFRILFSAKLPLSTHTIVRSVSEPSRNPVHLKFACGKRSGLDSPPHIFANFAASKKSHPKRLHPPIDSTAFPVEVDSLTQSFDGKPIFSDISFSLPEHAVLGISAPSGSGKTTLLRILARLDAPVSGSFSPLSCAYVFQENRLFEELNALDNVRLVCSDDATVKHYLFSLLPEEDCLRPCATLSGGMKRMVAIARALAAPAPVLLLDEPFTALDEDAKKRAAELIRSSQKTILVTTHIREEFSLLHAEILPISF